MNYKFKINNILSIRVNTWLEMLFILFFIVISYLFISIPSPSWVYSTVHLHEVLNITFAIFKDNFLGVLVVSIIEIFLFSLLFNKVFYRIRFYLRFILSNIVAALIILAVYVYITDIYFLYALYPNYWLAIP